jgi:phosphopantetheine--protein transferase-like protein
MGLHCGVDIIEIDRVKKAVDSGGKAFKDRVFTEREIMYCEARKAAKYQSYAARFAAKEAVSKAFGTGISAGFLLKDIEVDDFLIKIPGAPILPVKLCSIFIDENLKLMFRFLNFK